MVWFLVLALLLPATAEAEMGQARRSYNKMWNRHVDWRLGVDGQPAPEMQFVRGLRKDGASERTLPGPAGQRTILLSRGTRRQLKSPNPWRRRLGQRDVAHGMRHAYQPDSLFVGDNDQSLPWGQCPAEQDATAFAREVMQGIPKRNERKRVKRKS